MRMDDGIWSTAVGSLLRKLATKGRSRRCNYAPWNIAPKALLLLMGHLSLSKRDDSSSDCIISRSKSVRLHPQSMAS